MEKQMRKFITASLLAASAAVAAPAVAELQFYGTYENESLFNNETYVHNSAINAARLGVGTERFYLVGPGHSVNALKMMVFELIRLKHFGDGSGRLEGLREQ